MWEVVEGTAIRKATEKPVEEGDKGSSSEAAWQWNSADCPS